MTTQSEGFNRWRSMSKNHWALLIIGVLCVVAVIGWLRPVQVVVDKVAEPVAVSVGIGSRTCPSGWVNKSSSDEHVRVKACEKDGYLVVLDEADKFQHAIPLDKPGSQPILNPLLVPNWPTE